MHTFRMNRKGLGLTGIIIGALILSLAAAGSFAAFVWGIKITKRANRQIIAMNFARQTAEKLKNDIQASTWPNSVLLKLGAHTSALPTGKLPAGATRTYQVTNVDLNGDGKVDYKKVTIKVHWREP